MAKTASLKAQAMAAKGQFCFRKMTRESLRDW